jgi:hypothetical protein
MLIAPTTQQTDLQRDLFQLTRALDAVGLPRPAKLRLQ